MITRYIVSTQVAVPDPEAIAQALQAAGHSAVVDGTRDSHLTALTSEFAIGSAGDRVLLAVSEDLHAGQDVDTSSHEMVAELVPENERSRIRRLIEVRYWAHADPSAVETLVSYLCRVTAGREVSTG